MGARCAGIELGSYCASGTPWAAVTTDGGTAYRAFDLNHLLNEHRDRGTDAVMHHQLPPLMSEGVRQKRIAVVGAAGVAHNLHILDCTNDIYTAADAPK